VILRAESLGQGEPLVLLHGLFGRGRNLAAVARGLAATRRVVSLDLRNHGDSPHGPGMDYRTLAGDVLETLAALGALPAAILGHSMGGKTAMACALIAPQAVRRLLVADIAPVPYAHHNAAIAAAMRAMPRHPGMTRADAAAWLADAVPNDGVRGFLLQNFVPGAAPCWRIGLDEIAAGMADIEGWPAFPAGTQFGGPTLFLSGALSDYVTAGAREICRQLFPMARFVALKNAGHWLHADQPEAFLRVAEEFFGAD
jgi:pimeloyl-ACP methyl ester carboxylesterase